MLITSTALSIVYGIRSGTPGFLAASVAKNVPTRPLAEELTEEKRYRVFVREGTRPFAIKYPPFLITTYVFDLDDTLILSDERAARAHALLVEAGADEVKVWEAGRALWQEVADRFVATLLDFEPVNHRDKKSLFGVGDAQVWSEKAAPRVPQFLVAIYAMLLLASLRAYGPKRTDDYLPLPAWRKQETRRPSIMDILAGLFLLAKGPNTRCTKTLIV